MRYNIIGDTHCRTSWKKLVRDDSVNIFVGDYFSPYCLSEYEEQERNFKEILEYKEKHPETVLLIGNHDDQHWVNIDANVSRFDSRHQRDIQNLFETNKKSFVPAYGIENKILITHAGVSYPWFFKYYNKSKTFDYLDLTFQEADDQPTIKKAVDAFVSLYPFWNLKLLDNTVACFHDNFYVYLESRNEWEKVEVSIDDIVSFVNHMWETEPSAFNFNRNADHNDYCGTSPTQGPMWVRPSTLYVYNILKCDDECYQIFGHTMNNGISFIGDEKKLICVDCLEFSEESLIVDVENGEIKFKINKNE